MNKEIVNTNKAPQPAGPYSQAVKANGFLFLAGQVPIVPETGEFLTGAFSEQCHLALKNIKAVLDAGGSSLNDVVKVTIFLKNMEDFGELNSIYGEYFSESKPARTCIQAGRLPRDVDVEIEAVALCP